MKSKKTILATIIGLVALFIIFYYFSYLFFYTAAAFIISIIGSPLVELLKKYLKIPYPLGSIFSLALIAGVLLLLFSLLVPQFYKQAENLSKINYAQLTKTTYTSFHHLEDWARERGFDVEQDFIKHSVLETSQKIIKKIDLQNTVTNTVSILSSTFVAIFSIFFISFFLLKDKYLFKKTLFMFIPEKYTQKTQNIMTSSEKLLSRYFIGLTIEVLCMMTLLSTSLYFLGVENPILYGCIGGFLNIIPYLGPVIGAIITCVLSLMGHIGTGASVDIMQLLLKIIGTFVGANLIDNMLLQVLIYSNSVKAHPLEIFFVIMIGGTIGGVLGMILAIPIYTVLRVIAREFFKETKFVRELTRSLDD